MADFRDTLTEIAVLDRGGAFHNVRAFGALGDGATDDRAVFASVDAGRPDGYVPAGTYRIGSSLTFAKRWEFAPGAVLRPASGVTITFAVDPIAGVHPIFDLSLGGTVVGLREVRPEWFGSTASHVEVQRALAAGKMVLMTLPATGASAGSTANLTENASLVGSGQTLTNIGLMAVAASDGVRVSHARFQGTPTNGAICPVRGYGMRAIIDGLVVRGNWTSGAENFGGRNIYTNLIIDCEDDLGTGGTSDVMEVYGEMSLIANVIGFTPDDSVVFKATNARGDSRAHLVANVIAKMAAGVFDVGTQVGFGNKIEGITAIGGVGQETVAGVLVKGGKLAGHSGGYVRNMSFSHITVHDPEGVRFNRGVDVWARVGTQVEDIRVSDLHVLARVEQGASVNSALVHLEAIHSTIADADVPITYTPVGPSAIKRFIGRNLSHRDPYQGADDAAAPGMPMIYGAKIFEMTGGIIEGCDISDFSVDGVRSDVLYLSCPSGNEIKIRNVRARNWGTTNTAAAGLRVFAGTSVNIRGLDLGPILPGRTPVVIENGATVVSEQAFVPLGPVVAGTAIAFPILTAVGRRFYVYEVQIVAGSTISQADANYVTGTLRKNSTGFNAVGASFTTQTTASGGSALTAAAPIRIGSSYFTGVNSQLNPGDTMFLAFTHTGSGRAIPSSAVIVKYIEY